MTLRLRILTVVGMLGWLVACRREPDFRFAVRFDERKPLAQGDPVTFRGDSIGKVEKVEVTPTGGLLVQLAVAADTATSLCRECVYRIAEGDAGHGEIVVKTVQGTSTPLVAGDTVDGADNLVEELGRQTAGVARAAAKVVGDVWGEIKKLDRELRGSSEWDRLMKNIEDFVADSSESGRETIDELKTRRLPELEAEARRVKESLEKSGKLEEAKRFWESFEKWLAEQAAALDQKKAS